MLRTLVGLSENAMEKIIVAAKSDNNVIGRNGDVPWHLPADLAFFEETISDGWLLSGRRSYESVQGDFIFKKGRKTIIITRQKTYKASDTIIANSVMEGIQKAETADAPKLYILGGGEIYAQALNLADKLIITEIHTIIKDGDTYFPEIDPAQWRETSRQNHSKDAENPYDYSFVIWERC